jgi:hypothetical protein
MIETVYTDAVDPMIGLPPRSCRSPRPGALETAARAESVLHSLSDSPQRRMRMPASREHNRHVTR